MKRPQQAKRATPEASSQRPLEINSNDQPGGIFSHDKASTVMAKKAPKITDIISPAMGDEPIKAVSGDHNEH